MVRKWTLRQKITVLSLLITVLILVGYALYNGYRSQANSLMSFDPADYGLPAQKGSYEMIAVVPSENMNCMAAEGFELLLYPLPDQPQTLTREDLDVFERVVGRPLQTSIAFQMMTLEEVKNHVAHLNAEKWPVGCNLIPKVLVTLTPRPTSTLVPKKEASYNPADYGLPTEIGGYEIMVAIPSENQKCSPPNQLRLMLHALPDQPQTLTAGDEEQLKTITNRPIQLTFLSGVVTIGEIKRQTEEWNEWMADGCIILGGPIPDEFTPDVSFATAEGVPPPNSPIIPPTPDMNAIIAPPTRVEAAPPPNNPIIPPTPDAG